MPRTTSGLTYRPALDGLRGIAVAAVLTFHLWPSALQGGWLGVDLFFVLSGFLITTLLVREYAGSGHINLPRFWLRRFRRLMPPLVVMLLAVLIASAYWTIPTRRPSVALDVLSALFYGANWRFLTSDEAYFGAVSAPSPVRHTWSLAIEEQYYIVFPLLILVLAAVFHKRRQLALAIGVIAVVSAARMGHLYTPGVDPTRLYFGTDTRAFELLIGAVAGAWVGPAQWGREYPSRWVLAAEKLAFPAIVGLVIAFFAFDENSSMLFRGGLFGFCVIAIAPILAAASPHHNAFQRLLSFEPLRRLGLISYSLYLWHWPVHVFLSPAHLGVSETPAAIIQLVVSLALAIASFHFVERPIRKHGLAGWMPRRPQLSRLTAVLAVVGVVFGAALLPKVATAGGSSADTGGGGGGLTISAPTYTPGSTKRNVVILGNSIPFSLQANLPAGNYPDLNIQAVTSFGCTPFVGEQFTAGKLQPVSEDCRKFQDYWQQEVKNTDVTAFFVPQNLLDPYRVDGVMLNPGTGQHDKFIEDKLDEVRSKTLAQGAKHFAIVTFACRQIPAFGTNNPAAALNNFAKVKHLNEVASEWAKTKNVPVIDQYGLLCGGDTYHGQVNGGDLYADGLHYNAHSGPIFWSWFAPQLQKIGNSK